MPERVTFDLDAFMARLERQHVISFDDVEILAAVLEDVHRQLQNARLAAADLRQLALKLCDSEISFTRDVSQVSRAAPIALRREVEK